MEKLAKFLVTALFTFLQIGGSKANAQQHEFQINLRRAYEAIYMQGTDCTYLFEVFNKSEIYFRRVGFELTLHHERQLSTVFTRKNVTIDHFPRDGRIIFRTEFLGMSVDDCSKIPQIRVNVAGASSGLRGQEEISPRSFRISVSSSDKNITLISDM